MAFSRGLHRCRVDFGDGSLPRFDNAITTWQARSMARCVRLAWQAGYHTPLSVPNAAPAQHCLALARRAPTKPNAVPADASTKAGRVTATHAVSADEPIGTEPSPTSCHQTAALRRARSSLSVGRKSCRARAASTRRWSDSRSMMSFAAPEAGAPWLAPLPFLLAQRREVVLSPSGLGAPNKDEKAVPFLPVSTPAPIDLPIFFPGPAAAPGCVALGRSSVARPRTSSSSVASAMWVAQTFQANGRATQPPADRMQWLVQLEFANTMSGVSPPLPSRRADARLLLTRSRRRRGDRRIAANRLAVTACSPGPSCPGRCAVERQLRARQCLGALLTAATCRWHRGLLELTESMVRARVGRAPGTRPRQ